ncbi:MAG: dapB [Gammaproteobacteria bacterium]|jgi:4-hydroxy-tetrahydrodipicolinate reductase|nr:dapB [Gammaproteobacteria bacterium]
MKNVKVIVNGAKGRMGQCAVSYLSAQEGIELVAKAVKGDDLSALIHDYKADVVVDLTRPEAAYQNALTIIAAGARPVIGTTGIREEDIIKLQTKCRSEKRGGIIAPNFSISAVLIMKFAAELVRHLPAVEIIELHHDKKKDAPSGTAIKTAQMISEARKEARLAAPKDPTTLEHYPGSRGGKCDDVPIHSIRLPGFLASQEVIFGSQGETLSLRHNSISRDAFMPGITLACQRVMDLTELVYGLEKLL